MEWPCFTSLWDPLQFQTSFPQRLNDTAAAVKIQSAFRGFSVRKSAPLKNMKFIAQVKANMEDIRQRIEDPQVVQMIRQNEKERLKITEGLMSLLLKLDAIQVL
eukprot:Gb_07388 [translate_table: standard]